MPRPSIPPGSHGAFEPKKKGRAWAGRTWWRDLDGGYHQLSFSGATKQEALDNAATRWLQVVATLDAKRLEAQARTTLDVLAERWLRTLEAADLIEASTIEQYRATWRGTLSPVLGHVDINVLTRALAQEVLYEGLFRRRKGHEGPDGQWVPGEYVLDAEGNRIPLVGDQPRNVLHLLLRWAADRGIREDGLNVLAGTERPRRPAPEPRALTPTEWHILIGLASAAATRHHRADDALWAVLLFMAYTGCRMSEALGLVWDDVDFDDPPTVRITVTLKEARGKQKQERGKATKGKDERYIRLLPPLVAMLQERKERGKFTDPSDYVFASQRGGSINQGNLRTRLRTLVEGTDLAWVTSHSLRRTYLTRAAEAFDAQAAAEFGGHRDDHVTKRHYIEKKGLPILDPTGLFEDLIEGGEQV